MSAEPDSLHIHLSVLHPLSALPVIEVAQLIRMVSGADSEGVSQLHVQERLITLLSGSMICF